MIEDLTARQLVAGLMRGNAQTLQRGYGPEAAVHAAATRHNLTASEADKLLAYAEGFLDGFAEDGRRGNPVERISDAAFPESRMGEAR